MKAGKMDREEEREEEEEEEKEKGGEDLQREVGCGLEDCEVKRKEEERRVAIVRLFCLACLRAFSII